MKNLMKVLMVLIIALFIYSCATTASGPVELPEGEYIVFEGEDAVQLDDVWMTVEDEKASGGKYIYTDIPKNKPVVEEGTQAVYKFNVAKAGTYVFYLRARMFDDRNTSYYFNVNGIGILRTDFKFRMGWLWGFLNDDNPLRPEKIELQEGENTLIIYHREANVYLDKIVVSDVEGLTDAQLESVK